MRIGRMAMPDDEKKTYPNLVDLMADGWTVALSSAAAGEHRGPYFYAHATRGPGEEERGGGPTLGAAVGTLHAKVKAR